MPDTAVKESKTVGDIVDSLPVIRRPEAPAPQPWMSPGANLLQIAIEKGADLATLERLMDMQARWEADQARKAFVAAMAAFKAEPPTIMKNKKAGYESRSTGDSVSYEFATLDNVAAVIGAALSKHGLSATWGTSQLDGGKIRVTCSLRHALGHSEETSLEALPDGSGKKNAIQQIGSTVTYLERYTLLAITGLAAKGQDDDSRAGGAAPGPISEEQKATLVDLMRQAGELVDPSKLQARFCSRFKIERMDDLPASAFKDAHGVLVETINANSKNKVP